MAWLLTPPDSRAPATQRALAAQLGIHEDTIGAYKREYAFSAEYNRRWRKLTGGPENIQQVVDKLREKALEGSAQHMKLYLEWAGELNKEEAGDDPLADFRAMTDEELDAALEG